ncbi:MAG TPA: hypothetical protein P5528_14580 [Steroidobacteraceae bacterium]|nr:hypothetical protein [Steroidobacteraceae bacterium]HRX90662.1 hypothetical protein [Steroidobacteraceae bacterium]
MALPAAGADALAPAGTAPQSLAQFEQALRASSWFATGAAERVAFDVPLASPAAARGLLAGASVFSSSAFSSVDEVIDVGRRRSYQQFSLAGGVRIPLLGSRLRYNDELADQELAQLADAAELESQQRELVTRLRRAYIELWSARVRRELAARYQGTATAMGSILQQRTAAALLLESDRLEFMSGFARAALERSRAEADEQNAAAELAILTESQVGAITPPVIEFGCTLPSRSSDDVDSILDRHPELVLLRTRAEHYARLADATGVRAVQSDLRVGISSSYEPTSGDAGQAAFVSLSFDYAFGAAKVERSTARLRVRRAASAYRLRRAQLSGELTRLLEFGRTLDNSTELARLGAEASAVRLHERTLRAARLAGDVIEQLQQARYANYRATLAEHQATREAIDWQISVAAFLPADCDVREGGTYLTDAQADGP